MGQIFGISLTSAGCSSPRYRSNLSAHILPTYSLTSSAGDCKLEALIFLVEKLLPEVFTLIYQYILMLDTTLDYADGRVVQSWRYFTLFSLIRALIL